MVMSCAYLWPRYQPLLLLLMSASNIAAIDYKFFTSLAMMSDWAEHRAHHLSDDAERLRMEEYGEYFGPITGATL